MRQRINLMLTLRGAQDVHVVAHHPDTDSARVSARIGNALLYFHDWPSAAAIARGWHQMSREAFLLPRRLPEPAPDMRRVDRVRAVTSIDIEGVVQVGAEMVNTPGFERRLLVTMGRLEMLVLDRSAYDSVRTAFRDAEVLCSSVIPKAPGPTLHSIAVDRATRALTNPGPSVGRPPGATPRRPPLQPLRKAQTAARRME